MGRMVNALTGAKELLDAGEEATPVKLLSDYRGHPSLRTFLADGCQVITF